MTDFTSPHHEYTGGYGDYDLDAETIEWGLITDERLLAEMDCGSGFGWEEEIALRLSVQNTESERLVDQLIDWIGDTLYSARSARTVMAFEEAFRECESRNCPAWFRERLLAAKNDEKHDMREPDIIGLLGRASPESVDLDQVFAGARNDRDQWRLLPAFQLLGSKLARLYESGAADEANALAEKYLPQILEPFQVIDIGTVSSRSGAEIVLEEFAKGDIQAFVRVMLDEHAGEPDSDEARQTLTLKFRALYSMLQSSGHAQGQKIVGKQLPKNLFVPDGYNLLTINTLIALESQGARLVLSEIDTEPRVTQQVQLAQSLAWIGAPAVKPVVRFYDAAKSHTAVAVAVALTSMATRLWNGPQNDVEQESLQLDKLEKALFDDAVQNVARRIVQGRNYFAKLQARSFTRMLQHCQLSVVETGQARLPDGSARLFITE